MTTQRTVELFLNITASNTWTQVLDQSTGSAYTVSASSRCDVRDVSALNLGANPVTFEYGIGPDATITDAERKLTPVTLAAGSHYEGSRQHTIPAGMGLWARAVGTSPNLTVSAQALEISP